MLLATWILLGMLSGLIWRHFDMKGVGMIVDMILGAVGAFLCGNLFGLLTPPHLTVMGLYSVPVAVAGSLIVLFTYNAMGRNQPHRRWDDFPLKHESHRKMSL
jgi:uncharacterized membrane protein YeaQ/YmgE (transglycosylase-associated protein family)